MRANPVLMSCNLNKRTAQSMEESKTVKCLSIHKLSISLLFGFTSVRWSKGVLTSIYTATLQEQGLASNSWGFVLFCFYCAEHKMP